MHKLKTQILFIILSVFLTQISIHAATTFHYYDAFIKGIRADNQIYLSWVNPSNIRLPVTLERTTNSISSTASIQWTPIATANTTTFIDTTISPAILTYAYRIQAANVSGNSKTSYPTPIFNNKYAQIVIAPDDTLYTSAIGNYEQVIKYDAQGTSLGIFSAPSTNQTAYPVYYGTAVNNSNLFALSSLSPNIQKFGLDGTFQGSFANLSPHISGFALTQNNQFILLDAANRSFKVTASDGTLIRTIPIHELVPSSSAPAFCTLDSQGNTYIGIHNQSLYSILKYNSNLEFVTTVTSTSNIPLVAFIRDNTLFYTSLDATGTISSQLFRINLTNNTPKTPLSFPTKVFSAQPNSQNLLWTTNETGHLYSYPPPQITTLQATSFPNSTLVHLRAIPSAPGVESITIIRATNHYPTSRTDGTVVTQNCTSTELNDKVPHEGIYYYAAFTSSWWDLATPATTRVEVRTTFADLVHTSRLDESILLATQNVTIPILHPQIGIYGTASLNLTTIYTSSDSRLGIYSGSIGELLLSTKNAVWRDLGNVYLGLAGKGIVTQSDGQVQITGRLTLGGEPHSSGNYILSGGDLTVGSLVISSGTGSFKWTGGSLETASITGSLTNYGGTFIISNSTPVTLTGLYRQTSGATTKVILNNTSTGIVPFTKEQRIEPHSLTVSPIITIYGSYEAAGTLNITMDGFVPVPDTKIQIFSTPPTGTFNHYSLPSLDSRLKWGPTDTLYTDGSISILASGSTLLVARPLNYPNPFKLSTGTYIGYYLNQNADIDLRIYRSSGAEVFRIALKSGVDNGAKAGYNKVTLNRSIIGNSLSAGIYPYLLISDRKVIGKGKLAVEPE